MDFCKYFVGKKFVCNIADGCIKIVKVKIQFLSGQPPASPTLKECL